MKPKISIIIPAYNEDLTIGNVLADFAEHYTDGIIYVIDNNSTDDTAKISKEQIKKHGLYGHVLFVKKQGKANALREALNLIESDVYVLIDADHTYFAKDVKKLIDPILHEHMDMVVGDRFADLNYQKENKRFFHNFGNASVRRAINFLFDANLQDIMSGYRALSNRFVKNYPIMCEGFELETEMTLHALDKKFNIREIPITYKDRISGSQSKLNTYRDGLKVILTILTILKDYRPFYFFSICSGIFLILGLATGAVPVIEYLEYRYIFRVPLAILATGLMILSMLLFFVGLILDTISRFHKFNYLLRLQKQN
jgi:glycosyltransferase involved in cell wall biosynthesis